MTFEVTILGSTAAVPMYSRHPTAQFVQYENTCLLFDCAEATQIQITKFKKKATKIDHIFISHLHGDHYFGLLGLLSSLSLQHRTETLHLYAHAGLAEILTVTFKHSHMNFTYPLEFHEIKPETEQVLFENDQILVRAFPVRHRITCNGFAVEEKQRQRKLIKEKMLPDFTIPEILALKSSEDVLRADGTVLKMEDFTQNFEPRRYVFCTDTIYTETILPYIAHADLLYHESTFLDDMADYALMTGHSTARQAAEIARKAQVKRLILGHFSIRYLNLEAFLAEARSIFPETYLATEGLTFEIKANVLV